MDPAFPECLDDLQFAGVTFPEPSHAFQGKPPTSGFIPSVTKPKKTLNLD